MNKNANEKRDFDLSLHAIKIFALIDIILRPSFTIQWKWSILYTVYSHFVTLSQSIVKSHLRFGFNDRGYYHTVFHFITTLANHAS